MGGAKPRNLLRGLLMKSVILPPCEYRLLLINFILNDQKSFPTNSAVCNININTTNQYQLHKPNENLSCFQKGTYIPYCHQNTQQSTMQSHNFDE